jgi:hypothetical protein
MGWVHGMIMRIISTEPSSWIQYCFKATYLFDYHSQWEYLTWREASSEMPIFRHWRHSLIEKNDTESTYGSLELTFLAWRWKNQRIDCVVLFQQVSTQSFWWWFLQERNENEHATFHSSKDATTKKQRVAYAFAIKTLLLAGRWQSTNSTCVVPRQQSRHTRE